MPLSLINIRPGFNKQITDTAAEGQYVDGDFVRFRSGLPEKIGGWEKITTNTLVGVARAQHQYTDLDGRIYAAIGTLKCLYIYYQSAFYDITPLETAQTGATFNTTNGSAVVTVNLSGHLMQPGDLFTFTSVTPPTGAGYTAGNFEDQTFEVTSRLSASAFTVTMATNATADNTTNGAATINRYVKVGNQIANQGFGWGTDLWGGQSSLESFLNGAINNSVTTITLTSTTGFPTSGSVQIDSEIIAYTGISGNDLTGCTRGSQSTTPASHSNGAAVTALTGWGSDSLAGGVDVNPGNWSLDNFGQILIATIFNGRTFTWQPIQNTADALATRATVMSGAPTKSIMTIVSDQDRHLIHLGTETTIGDDTTQDKMFIRFSNQEDFNTYEPTSTNTAGTFRIDDGTEIRAAIRAKDYILVTTDTAAYTIQYVGAPFTFSIRKVGSNCGAIGPHSMQFKDGIVYWMDDSGGFNYFDGTVKTLECTVEDFVFTENNPGDLGLNYVQGKLVYAGNNCLFGEVTWYYPSSNSNVIDRAVTWNRGENCWYTSSLARTTQHDAHLFDKPYKTSFDATATPTFPTIQGVSDLNGATTYWEHETGTDQNANGVITTVEAFVESGDFMIHQGGDGELFTKIRRFIPDFKRLEGSAQITINLKNYPTDTASSSSLGPFDITSSTDKVDTRARGRAASLKIENTSSGQTWRYGTFRADVQPDGRR
tara:strand:+ start:242 stop:2374 length:2133 start_codon:yes stop_codon:yes gene_type:complete